jgi:hypothetical protein
VWNSSVHNDSRTNAAVVVLTVSQPSRDISGHQRRPDIAAHAEDGAGQRQARRPPAPPGDRDNAHHREGAGGTEDGDDDRLPDGQAAKRNQGGAQRQPQDADVRGEPHPEQLQRMAVALAFGGPVRCRAFPSARRLGRKWTYSCAGAPGASIVRVVANSQIAMLTRSVRERAGL